MLVSLGIVLISLMYNVFVLFRKESPSLELGFYGVHNFFHIIAVALILFTGHEILDIS